MSNFSQTTVVLDTSVLMSQENVLDIYDDADIVLPITVIDELDNNKHRDDEAGRNARSVLRQLEVLRDGTDMALPIALSGGGSVRIVINGVHSEVLKHYHLDSETADHRIIGATLGLLAECSEVTLVSNDAAMRIKAAVVGLNSCEHTSVLVRPDKGWATIEVPYQDAEKIRNENDHGVDIESLESVELLQNVPVNGFLVLRSGTASLLAKRTERGVTSLPQSTPSAWGACAKNKEQAFSLQLLTDPLVSLVALDGPAGTGKTFLAIAAGLEQTFEQNLYSRMTIVRPIISVGGQDLGFLPGDLHEKLGPWFESVVDTMVALSTTRQTHRECADTLRLWIEQGRLTLEAVTFLRGRSLQNTYVLVDEVQNLEISTVKTIITRLGQGSKGVLVGDTSQVDNPWTTSKSNGLTATMAAFASDPEFGHITLTAGQRSTIADKAARML